jgi:hypothetical protein
MYHFPAMNKEFYNLVILYLKERLIYILHDNTFINVTEFNMQANISNHGISYKTLNFQSKISSPLEEDEMKPDKRWGTRLPVEAKGCSRGSSSCWFHRSAYKISSFYTCSELYPSRFSRRYTKFVPCPDLALNFSSTASPHKLIQASNTL